MADVLPTQVYVVDDDPSIQRALKRALEIAGFAVEIADDALTFARTMQPAGPAVILLDMRMPAITGLEVQRTLLARNVHTPILFISGQSESVEIVEAFRNGASNFLLKPFKLEELTDAVDKAIELDAGRLAASRHFTDVRAHFAVLTPKEQEICLYLLRGYGNKEIGELNGSAAATVKLHRRRVLAKMNVGGLPQLIEAFHGIDLVELQNQQSVS